MRKHHHNQRLRLSLAALTCFIIFQALLLNVGQLAAMSCDAEPISPTCPNISFPFRTSQACVSESSFFMISGCALSNTEIPRWPNFPSDAGSTDNQLGGPYVMGFYNPFPDTNKFGFINLTWNQTPINKSPPCQSLATLEQISSHYLPQPIHLKSFANSSFQLTPSNIILLFNCRNSDSHKLRKNSSACISYEQGCSLGSSNCYQYIPDDSQELNLPEVMQSSNCENGMFFVVANQLSNTPVSQWSPGLIQLNWSTNNNPWTASTLNSCEGCFQADGSCGYHSDDNFLCYCDNNTFSDTICTPDKGCSGLLCNNSAKIAGVVVVTLIIVSCLVTLYFYYKKRKGFFTKIVPPRLATREILFGSSNMIISHRELDGLTERPIEYQYSSIVFATNSFSNLLGEGGFGAVYKGTLFDDAKDDVQMEIAVKVHLEVRSKHSKKQFFNEVAAIGRIHHVNVVRLLGFCIEENHEILVYEYVINGSLDKWLFHCGGSQNQVLLWEQRYVIAVGIAKGLSYLHEECRHHIVHCDIKPQNILLDGQMCPKIADFGLARLMGREESGVVTLAKGTPGYIGPEFWMGGESQLSTKFDVYSYGMVLLELISGERNFRDGKRFPEMAFEAAMGGDFKSIVDVKMGITKTVDDDELESMQWQQVRTGVLVALWCIQDHPTNRPSMNEVVQYLEGRAAINERPPRPTIASSTIAISSQQHACLSSHLQYITPISGGR